MMHAPGRLPLAPRPISAELLSSWLMRVAAVNVISLAELLDGLKCRYGPVLGNAPIDYGLPEMAVIALAKFCRVEPEAIRMLDLGRRLPHPTSASFLRFTGKFQVSVGSQRVGYGFCPLCIAGQTVTHLPWEWSLAWLSRCAIH
jgi:TniQ